MLRQRPMSRVPQETALEIWSQVVEALQFIHSLGIMHRDVHSGNVLVQHSATSQTTLTIEELQGVKLADFGKATNFKKVSGDKPAPMFTARTCPIASIAPEVLFRRGTVWSPTGKRSAIGQRLGSPCLEQHLMVSAPRDCTYDEKIDIWGSGVLFILMRFGGDHSPPDETDSGRIGHHMIGTFGKVPRDLANAEGWSLPSDWIMEGGQTCHGGCLYPRLRAASEHGSLIEAERFGIAMACLDYCPRKRPRHAPTSTSSAASSSQVGDSATLTLEANAGLLRQKKARIQADN